MSIVVKGREGGGREGRGGREGERREKKEEEKREEGEERGVKNAQRGNTFGTEGVVYVPERRDQGMNTDWLFPLASEPQ